MPFRIPKERNGIFKCFEVSGSWLSRALFRHRHVACPKNHSGIPLFWNSPWWKLPTFELFAELPGQLAVG